MMAHVTSLGVSRFSRSGGVRVVGCEVDGWALTGECQPYPYQDTELEEEHV